MRCTLVYSLEYSLGLGLTCALRYVCTLSLQGNAPGSSPLMQASRNCTNIFVVQTLVCTRQLGPHLGGACLHSPAQGKCLSVRMVQRLRQVSLDHERDCPVSTVPRRSVRM